MTRPLLTCTLICGLLAAGLALLGLFLSGLLGLLGDETGSLALWQVTCGCGLVAVLLQFLLVNLLALRSLGVRMGS